MNVLIRYLKSLNAQMLTVGSSLLTFALALVVGLNGASVEMQVLLWICVCMQMTVGSVVVSVVEKWMMKKSEGILREKLQNLPDYTLSLTKIKTQVLSKEGAEMLLARLILTEDTHYLVEGMNGTFAVQRKERYGMGPFRIVFIAKAGNEILIG